MKNRAKCKLCLSIVESFHAEDYVECKCGEIAVDKGDAMICYAKRFENFIRVDDQGHEIVVKVVDKESRDKISADIEEKLSESPNPISKKELIFMLEQMIDTIEALPQQAKTAPVSHYDYLSLLVLVLALSKAPPGV